MQTRRRMKGKPEVVFICTQKGELQDYLWIGPISCISSARNTLPKYKNRYNKKNR